MKARDELQASYLPKTLVYYVQASVRCYTVSTAHWKNSFEYVEIFILCTHDQMNSMLPQISAHTHTHTLENLPDSWVTNLHF